MRNGPASASMAPRQGGLQAPALGVPVYPQAAMAMPYAAPPMMLYPRPQVGGASGRGGFMQRLRNTFQEIRQFPQQLHQLAQQATQYRPNLFQNAMDTAHQTIHTLQSGALQTSFNPPAQPHPQVPALGIPAAWLQQPAAPMKHVDEPMVLTPRPQVQGAAQMFSAQAHSFDPALLSQQLGPAMHQTLQHVLDNIRQLQALAADGPHMGVAAAPVGVPADAVPQKAKLD